MSRKLVIAISCATTAIASSALVAFAGSGQGWWCNGDYNCAGATCVMHPDYPAGSGQPSAWSCANIVPVDHPKCEYIGEVDRSCHETQRWCARLDYFAGGVCQGDPEACGGGSVDISSTVSEAGCGSDL